ncbi:DUF2637 domain-containing protein [Streptomyces hygroscopicus subsp. hygroscopicus]|uniref:DUF2637 domain-containing protein n=1 Tax=Streptomyces hygroscopicus TaxID=1912 RepID=UPI001C65D20E|nr:DUF2637 domain-containing protein [Streptomyces hygroscopicus]MBW8088589.1 DUF2637 domain-containing protein [Streptomyces hygroscopicus subsp. hygroscopicus]
MNRKAKTLLVLALVGVVGMAFRVSWNALRDIATAIGADPTAARLYAFVVDGLMALALVATLVLTKASDRKFALRVLAAYTVASLVLNYVHGLVPELHGGSVGPGRLADLGKVGWLLVLLATSLPVGSIYFGSDLVAKVLHHRPPTTADAQKTTDTESNRSMSDLGESTDEPPAPVADPTPLPAPAPVELPETDRSAPTGAAVPAESPRPRRSTGRVPDSARTTRPKRTPAELLDEARSATDDWSDEELTAERIRKAVHTSAEKARGLRDALRAERAESAESADAAAA